MDELIKRLEEATGPDRALDAEIHHVVHGGVGVGYASDALAYTGSIDAALTLVPEGWAWKVGYCCVSDDAWVVPDYNSPIHGARFRAEFGEPVYGEWTDVGIDVDQRPSGRPAIALCIAALKARKE